jgi:hypothetical protein
MYHFYPFTRFLILVLLLYAGFNSNAQYIKGAAIAGGNVSQVDGDEAFGYNKFGWQFGAAALVKFNKKWSLSLENIYNQKGANQGARTSDSLDGSYLLKLNYVEVPVLFHYTDRDRITVGAGFSWGRLVKVEEYKSGYRVDSTTLLGGPYNKNDWNILVDLRFKLYKGLKLNLRYAYSMVPIASRVVIDSKSGNPNLRDQYNNLISLRLMYIFNEPPQDVIEPKKAQND